MRELKVVVVDDNYWNRAAMARELDQRLEIAVVGAIDQNEAVAWSDQRWDGVDVAIVDVFDENAPSEIGTDVFSGIAALERIRKLPVRTLAITPHCQHPLVELRIFQAEADWLYHRWEVNDLDRLVDVLLNPRLDRGPVRPERDLLEAHGAVRARPNRAIAIYRASSLYGLLKPDLELQSLPMSRRLSRAFRQQIAEEGFTGTEYRSTLGTANTAPRWQDVRDYLLVALGRRDVPATETDREDAVSLRHPDHDRN